MQNPPPARLRIIVRGAVQGVGYRPFVHRLAAQLGLAGWVRNTTSGVVIEVEGPVPALEELLLRLPATSPPRSVIHGLEATWLDAAGHQTFAILESEPGGPGITLVPADIATCADCVREIFEPGNRRHGYPFTNCTHCGPRYSIIEALPYDRGNTAMRHFAMCPACTAEWSDPANRRFHAQPNACPECGPRLELWDRSGVVQQRGPEALKSAAAHLRQGRIVALKGLGGFQLLTPAGDENAVRRLRALKQREEKPFAVMFPSLATARNECEISALESRALDSPESPIVLVRRNGAVSALSEAVAPRNPCIGVLLPYTPLHHLLMAELGFPIVATSGNLTDEPICTEETEARHRLGPIADVFLVHNRPIVRAVDDSVVRIMAGREMILRRARGFAPMPVAVLNPPVRTPVLAVGAHLKSTVALAVESHVFLSQHIGDLENLATYEAFLRVTSDLPRLFAAKPGVVSHDTHPDYRSTQFARALLEQLPAGSSVRVPHHAAHVLACMAENELAPPVLGVAWDGTGDGQDGTVWGGEFLLVGGDSIHRIAHLRQFPLAGGDQAAKEPRRVALALLREILGGQVFDSEHWMKALGYSRQELQTLATMFQTGFHSPLTSSVGRLFDGVAALTGLRHRNAFEGQAAMELEFALEKCSIHEAYEFPVTGESGEANAPLQLDWRPTIAGVVADLERGRAVGEISARFHNGMVEGILAVARRCPGWPVALTGGCFQNRYLTERAVHRLRQEGFRPYWHQRVPPNDGGIALGQIIAALRARA